MRILKQYPSYPQRPRAFGSMTSVSFSFNLDYQIIDSLSEKTRFQTFPARYGSKNDDLTLTKLRPSLCS